MRLARQNAGQFAESSRPPAAECQVGRPLNSLTWCPGASPRDAAQADIADSPSLLQSNPVVGSFSVWETQWVESKFQIMSAG